MLKKREINKNVSWILFIIYYYIIYIFILLYIILFIISIVYDSFYIRIIKFLSYTII